MANSTQTWVKDKALTGLYQRVSNRSSVWAVKARRRGTNNVVTVTIGPCSLFSASKARVAAKEILALLAEGKHPNELRREEFSKEQAMKAEQKARSITLRQALEESLATSDRKPTTIRDRRQTIERNFGDWLDRPLNSITGKDVQERFALILDRVRARREKLNQKQIAASQPITTFNNKPGQGEAQRAFRYLQGVFNLVMADEVNGKPIIERNPVSILKAKKITRALIPRERYLLPKEREDLFDELTHCSHPEYKGPLLADDVDFTFLILMTGLRVDEARQLRWKNINFKESIFTAEDTKNRRNHTLPMTPAVERLFKRRFKAYGKSSEWVFPSPIDPTKCASMSRTFERLQQATGITFTAHDLRRTVATIASEMGYDLERIGAVLNHKKSGITARYVQTTIGSLRETLQAVEDEVLLSYRIT